jgi:hypothetical protein
MAKPAGRELGVPTGTVRAYLVRCGGITPVPRRRREGRLQLHEREEIFRGLAAGLSLRAIAAQRAGHRQQFDEHQQAGRERVSSAPHQRDSLTGAR